MIEFCIICTIIIVIPYILTEYINYKSYVAFVHRMSTYMVVNLKYFKKIIRNNPSVYKYTSLQTKVIYLETERSEICVFLFINYFDWKKSVSTLKKMQRRYKQKTCI